MQHVDPQLLSLMALGEPTFSKIDRAHLGTCAECTTDLKQLKAAAKMGRAAIGVGILVRPHARVWESVAVDMHRRRAQPHPDRDPITARRMLVTIAVSFAIAVIVVVGGILVWNALAPV